jgi:hypothetical protein
MLAPCRQTANNHYGDAHNNHTDNNGHNITPEPVAKVGYFYDGLRTFGSLVLYSIAQLP